MLPEYIDKWMTEMAPICSEHRRFLPQDGWLNSWPGLPGACWVFSGLPVLSVHSLCPLLMAFRVLPVFRTTPEGHCQSLFIDTKLFLSQYTSGEFRVKQTWAGRMLPSVFLPKHTNKMPARDMRRVLRTPCKWCGKIDSRKEHWVNLKEQLL